jgi:hypothetical protein
VRKRILLSRRCAVPRRPASQWALIGTSAALLGGCGESAVDKVANALEQAGAADVAEVVALDSVALGEWTRMLLFGPYTRPAEMAECLGITSARRLARNIGSLDNMHLLVVETPAGKYQSRELMRSKVDFSAAATGAAYTPTAARFVPTRTEWGSVRLQPEASPSMRCWPRRNASDSDTERPESGTGDTEEAAVADKAPQLTSHN